MGMFRFAVFASPSLYRLAFRDHRPGSLVCRVQQLHRIALLFEPRFREQVIFSLVIPPPLFFSPSIHPPISPYRIAVSSEDATAFLVTQLPPGPVFETGNSSVQSSVPFS